MTVAGLTRGDSRASPGSLTRFAPVLAAYAFAVAMAGTTLPTPLYPTYVPDGAVRCCPPCCSRR